MGKRVNPLVRHPLMQKGGAHKTSRKTQRQEARRLVDRELEQHKKGRSDRPLPILAAA